MKKYGAMIHLYITGLRFRWRRTVLVKRDELVIRNVADSFLSIVQARPRACMNCTAVFCCTNSSWTYDDEDMRHPRTPTYRKEGGDFHRAFSRGFSKFHFTSCKTEIANRASYEFILLYRASEKSLYIKICFIV
jgi:hypothetical protein